MEAYPEDYVLHNLPLILLSGLGEDIEESGKGDKGRTLLREGGFRITSDLPPIKTKKAQELLQCLMEHDSSKTLWNSKRAARSENRFVFRIRNTGRTHTLPPRKAPPPPHSPRLRPSSDNSTPPAPMILHSMLSPLTPSSPLYADGLMTSLWITKHQSRLPSLFVTFFTLSVDSSTSTLIDNRIKSDINNIRSVFASANYKTKVVVVLLGEDGLDMSEADERVSSIRRVANLDNKSLFFLPAQSSSTEVKDFCKSFLSTLYPVSIEYYRDLSKHARRKRSRNTVPQPTVMPTSGTSRLLPLQGWIVRYEFKLGVFAEFRQEMDAAVRNYEAAYDSLFGPEVFEAIPSWSPRFNDTRLLADAIAVRMIRCLLWNGQTTNAARRWLNHRLRVRDMVGRRGAGIETYGWEAWQSTWCKLMAHLIQQTEVLPLPDAEQEDARQKSILVHSEKTLGTNERFAPFESLHHEGYWLTLAQKYTQARRSRALQMPEEDRASPGKSPASTIASKAHLYDKYLTLEPYNEFPIDDRPGYDYTKSIIEDLDNAVQQFSKHSQIRMIQLLRLKTALEYMRSESWNEAVSALTDVWHDPMLRKSGWWILLREVGEALWVCANELDDAELRLKLRWELDHPLLAAERTKEIDPTERLEQPQPREPLQIALSTDEHLSKIVPRFAFATAEGHVGKTIDAQLSLQNLASSNGPGVRLVQVKIVFEGGLRPIYLSDNSENNLPSGIDVVQPILTDVQLIDTNTDSSAETKRRSTGMIESLSADADMYLAPGQTKVYQVQIAPREAGEVSVASITMMLEHDRQETTATVGQAEVASEDWWEIRQGRPVSRLHGKLRDVAMITVLPKPPKLEIDISELRKAYFTNEVIAIHLILSNLEEEKIVSGSVEARLISPNKDAPALRWDDQDKPSSSTNESSADFVKTLESRQLKALAVEEKHSLTLIIDGTAEAADHELEILLNYHLPSAPETVLRKSLTLDIPVIRPFEANFGFHSRKHSETWPGFFSTDSIAKEPSTPAGLKQQYLVSGLICSFAPESLEIEAAHLVAQKIVGQALCSTEPGQRQSPSIQTTLIQPEETQRFTFDMILQKQVLGDRQPVAVDFVLEVTWRRPMSDSSLSKSYKSILQVPRFLAPSSEPRVLLQVSSKRLPQQSLPSADSNTKNLPLSMCSLTYTIENPSLHFLTFNITMESTEEFAFSGPKAKSISLVPISRHDLTFNLIPHRAKVEEGARAAQSQKVSKDKDGRGKDTSSVWMRVNLEVVDAYFGQTLKVQAAGEGVRVDKSGNVLVRIG